MDENHQTKREGETDGTDENLLEQVENLRRSNEAIQAKIDDLLKQRQAQEHRDGGGSGASFVGAEQAVLNRDLSRARLRLFLTLIGGVSSLLSLLSVMNPELFYSFIYNYKATLFFSFGVVVLSCAALMGFSKEKKERNFVDIDEKLYSSRIEAVESERDWLSTKVSELEFELEHNHPSAPSITIGSINANSSVDVADIVREVTSDYQKERLERHDASSLNASAESKSFDIYMKAIIRALDLNIEIADNKASLLLDKGTTYLWRGIVFFVVSIVVWQVCTANFKVGDYAVWGMISCSMTFLVVEFLAAWFLRQYKSFTDASFNLVRVKSIFNRYFLSYLAIKEFSDAPEHLVDMRVQMLKVLEQDIKWLEPAQQTAGDMNHMIAMFESVSSLIEKLKLGSKLDSPAAS